MTAHAKDCDIGCFGAINFRQPWHRTLGGGKTSIHPTASRPDKRPHGLAEMYMLYNP